MKRVPARRESGPPPGSTTVPPPGPAKTGYGNKRVIAAVVVRLPAVRRPVAIPVLAIDLALVTTDAAATAARVTERYARRWSMAAKLCRVIIVAGFNASRSG
jgi:hypothetical protein